MNSVLIVDDDQVFATATQRILARLGHTATCVGKVSEARSTLKSDRFDMVILDLMLPDGSGLQLLEACDAHQPEARIALVTGHPSIKSLIKSLYGRNIDYLEKPLDLARLESLLATPDGGVGGSAANPGAQAHFGYLIGESQAMKQLYALIERVAAMPANVLLLGESGVGKELVAKSMHALANSAAPFVATNCGALHRELMGGELFGHEKGAFTGAIKQKQGLFERASGGTLFLDEITEMPLEQQPALLRVLESKTVVKVGGTVEIPVDCRVISATNRDMEAITADNCLREDLYFRLAVFPVSIPPLRERKGDIELLAGFFLEELNRENRTKVALNNSQLKRLESYHWPGNVRELRNVIQRAYILSDLNSQELALPEQFTSPYAENGTPELSRKFVGSTIDEIERKLITMTLEHCNGNKTQAADTLGISLKTLYSRLNHYNQTR